MKATVAAVLIILGSVGASATAAPLSNTAPLAKSETGEAKIVHDWGDGWHNRWRSHHRWGSHGGWGGGWGWHNRWRSHYRWGSHGGWGGGWGWHNRWRSHYRWGSHY